MLIKTDTELAILGGPKLNKKEPLRWNNSLGKEERDAVLEVMDSGTLSGFQASPNEMFWGGKNVKKLEASFKKEFNVKYAVAVNSATSALHCAMMSLGLDIGDEVITSPNTMSATSPSILMVGGIPIFADIEDETFCLDPQSVRKNINTNTKAICAVNILGHPANLNELRKIADDNNLILIEDNSQSPGATHYGKFTGTVGDIGVFSFNRHKVMQSGEGGVMVTSNNKIYEKASLFRNHGEAVVEEFGINDITNTVGLNLRMTELEAAIANEQFKKLETLNDERIMLANRLSSNLSSFEGITPPITLPNNKHVYYMYGIKYDENVTKLPRKYFVDAMLAEGFSIREGYLKPTYLEPLYQKQICFGKKGFPFSEAKRDGKLEYNRGLCPVTERIQDNSMVLTAIMQSPQTLDDMDLWTEGVKKGLSKKEKLIKHMKK